MFEWIEWIGHWNEMRFYYWSFFNWLVLVPTYLGGAIVLCVLGWLLGKVWKRGWIVVVLLVPVLLIAPFWEELNIAWNFGQLCKKDAGIFIYKTVEVDGFYDDTRSTHDGPRAKQAIEEYERSAYRFYEKKFRNTGKIVHIERLNGVWTPTVLDHPTAQYQYRQAHSHTVVSHKVKLFEWVVLDTDSGEAIAREKAYARNAPWFYVGLDRPTRFCPVFGDGGEKLTGGLYRLALKPTSAN